MKKNEIEEYNIRIDAKFGSDFQKELFEEFLAINMESLVRFFSRSHKNNVINYKASRYFKLLKKDKEKCNHGDINWSISQYNPDLGFCRVCGELSEGEIKSIDKELKRRLDRLCL
jgi:recombinational DNA repair protein RecR